jgi:parallel beta-helix repeat protein
MAGILFVQSKKNNMNICHSLSKRPLVILEKLMFFCFFLITFLMFSITVNAKNLYVNGSTGNDSVTYAANTQENPWRTIGRAVWGGVTVALSNGSEAAQAGDTVIVEAGTYLTTQAKGERYDPIYNPVNSGTQGNPITIRANGTVVLQSNTDGVGEPIIGAYQRDYIVWDGFYIDEANVHTKRDTGPVVIWGSDHCVIQNCEIKGVNQSWSDNHNGIRIEYSDYALIYKNIIYGFAGNWGDNEAGIMTYDTSYSVFANNLIYDNGSGIFIKGFHSLPEQTGNVVKYNIIRNNTKGVYVYLANNTKVFQNIIKENVNGLQMMSAVEQNISVPVNTRIANNIFDNNTRAVRHSQSDGDCSNLQNSLFRNNIVIDGSYLIYSEGCENIDLTTSDILYNHNNYYNQGGIQLRGAAYTLSSWQEEISQDISSLSINPQFQDRANNNYRLPEGSALTAAGVDILDLNYNGSVSDTIPLGLYVTGDEVVGTTTQPYVPPPSQPPQGLSIPSGFRVN